MKTKNHIIFLLAIVSLILSCCNDVIPSVPTTTTSSTTTIENGGPKPVVIRETGEGFYTIKDAISAASPGQHIDVAAGRYEENLVIKKQLYLIGEDRETTIIDGKGLRTAVVFEVGSDDSEIREFTIMNGGFNFDGILCYVSSLTVSRVIINETCEAINCWDYFTGTISQTLIKDNGYGINISTGAPLISEVTVEESGTGIGCSYGSTIVMGCNLENNFIGIYCSGPDSSHDIGGGSAGSPGNNVIRGNEYWDLTNVDTNPVKAENNLWDHTTALEIDSLDICDDDEDSWRGLVDFEPFLTSPPSATLKMKPRLLTVSSLFKDFFHSLFRSDLPASAIYISPLLEAKSDLARYQLLRSRYHSLADGYYSPYLRMRSVH